MLTYLNTNLFRSPAQTLVNTVNTVGVMGKGIALTFKQLYPDMYKEYRQLCKQGKLNVGKLHLYRTPNKTILNFPTKKHWRSPSQVAYIEAGLKEFNRVYNNYGISSISFPQLGCGNGELDWENQVKPLMEDCLKDLPIPVYIHIYPKSPDFVPERLDAEFARQVQLERQILSFAQVWQDLKMLFHNTPQIDMFTPTPQINEDTILFLSPQGESLTVHQEDLADLWQTLRLTGTLNINNVPQSIRADNATDTIFDLLAQLPYVEAIELHPLKQNKPLRGLQYVAPPQTTPTLEIAF